MAVQLTQQSVTVQWQVPDCSEARWNFYMAALHRWADRSGLEFTGALGCYYSPDLPPQLADRNTRSARLGAAMGAL